MKHPTLFSTFLLLFCSTMLMAQTPAKLEKIGNAIRLVQDGKPLLMLSGELHNSTSSTPKAFEAALKTAKAMGLNSVIASVSWEQIEPEEGTFDFTPIDNVLRLAYKYNMPLGLIWFASYKNGESSYAPMWVKKDTKRFFRAIDDKGDVMTTISPFCKEAVKADANAYSHLMQHIKENDTNRLIRIIQLENEMGLFTDIDHQKTALKAYQSEVPEEVISYIKRNEKTLEKLLLKKWTDNGRKTKGSWKDVFGDDRMTKQFFMAWAFARYANHISETGKAIYPLPTYVNAWQSDENTNFGVFPNCGPLVRVMDIYKATAPSVDILSPDVYSARPIATLDAYHRFDNPIFIPEISREAGAAYYVFGELDGICYAPFGFEEVYNDPYFVGEYKTLGELLPTISEYQGKNRMRGFLRQEGINHPNDTIHLKLGDYTFHIHYIKGERRAHGMIIQTDKDEFIVAGVGSYITFTSKKGEICKIGYAEEIERNGNKWETLFVLNGDETAHHNMLYLRGRMPNPDFEFDNIKIPGPIYRSSYQRMHREECLKRFKVSGIYRIKLFTYPGHEENIKFH